MCPTGAKTTAAFAFWAFKSANSTTLAHTSTVSKGGPGRRVMRRPWLQFCRNCIVLWNMWHQACAVKDGRRSKGSSRIWPATHQWVWVELADLIEFRSCQKGTYMLFISISLLTRLHMGQILSTISSSWWHLRSLRRRMLGIHATAMTRRNT